MIYFNKKPKNFYKKFKVIPRMLLIERKNMNNYLKILKKII